MLWNGDFSTRTGYRFFFLFFRVVSYVFLGLSRFVCGFLGGCLVIFGLIQTAFVVVSALFKQIPLVTR